MAHGVTVWQSDDWSELIKDKRPIFHSNCPILRKALISLALLGAIVAVHEWVQIKAELVLLGSFAGFTDRVRSTG